MSDTRNAIVEWAKWAHDNKAHFNYTEGPERMSAIGVYPPKFPINADCSAFVTWCYWIAGAPDPNGLHYDHEGYTGTLLHGLEIPRDQVQPGDVIVYGPGTGWHTALVIEAGADPLTISHGQQGDPSLVRVSQDGRQPQRYLRFKTEGTPRYPDTKPVEPVAKPAAVAPQPVADLTHIQSAPQAHQTPLEAPVAPAAPQVEEPATPTNKAHMGWPLLKEVEAVIEAVIEGPAA